MRHFSNELSRWTNLKTLSIQMQELRVFIEAGIRQDEVGTETVEQRMDNLEVEVSVVMVFGCSGHCRVVG